MKHYFLRKLLAAILVPLAFLFFANCGKVGDRLLRFSPDTPEPSFLVEDIAQQQYQMQKGFPTKLPKDGIQPWERLDKNGYVVSAVRDSSAVERGNPSRVPSVINLQSDFIPGVERFSEVGDVTDYQEASRFFSGSPGERLVSYATYRISLGPNQPGAISADVNLRLKENGELSSYFLAISDYGNGSWKWFGPYSDAHVRILLPAGDYTSDLGNSFILVAAYDGSNFDLVGIGINLRDLVDSSPPPTPGGLTARGIAGGILLEWIPVISADLAGYKIYYAKYPLSRSDGLGVKEVDYLEGKTRHILQANDVRYFRVSSVDVSGNESPLSQLALAKPLSGDIPKVALTTSAVSGSKGTQVTLQASGAELYDFDLNGDGIFDVSENTSGIQNVVLDQTGVIRPSVQGTTSGGGIAFAAVSLIITSNSRPVASANAVPSSGYAPLTVTFTGTAEDTDGTIVLYAWDFDGDGLYDYQSANNPNPPIQTYSTPGLYNVKFRAEDDKGAWDVDTISIQVLPNPTNQMPIITGITAIPTTATPDFTINFSVVAFDPDGAIVSYAWDFDNDGTDDAFSQTASFAYSTVGLYNAKVKATDNDGGYAVGYISVNIEDMPANIPPIITEARAEPSMGKPPLPVSFSAIASDNDGSIVDYRWDFENDGTWDYIDPTNPNTSHTYPSEGFFTARLRVQDDAGSVSNAYLGVFVFLNEPPVITGLSASPSVATPGTAVSFTSAANDPDGSISSWSWDFDNDGVEDSNLQNDSFIYSTSDLYHAKLTVTDNDGDIDVAFIEVRIEDNPPNIPPTIVEIRASVDDGPPPLVVTFSANAFDSDGSIVQYGWDFDNDGILDYTNPASGDTSYTYTSEGFYTARFQVTDDFGDASSAYLGINVTENFPPVALLSVSPSYVYLGEGGSQTVTLDAAGSYDPEGGSLTYAFDPLGTGDYTSFGSSSTYNYDYSFTGIFPASVRVKDSAGDVSETSKPVRIYRFGSTYATGSEGYGGTDISLAVFDGFPAICFAHTYYGYLFYARALDALGTSWAYPIGIDFTLVSGGGTSLINVQGNPAISYCEASLALKFVRALDSTGSGWNAPVIVDSGAGVGLYSSMAIVNGNPAIAYYDSTNGDLKYVRATSADGSSWGSPVIVDDGAGGDVGRHASLEVVNGNPAIAYYDDTNGILKFVRATDADGTSWGTPVDVDASGKGGAYGSLEIVNGNPAIGYLDVANGFAKFVRASDANGSSWGTPVTVDGSGNVGGYTSLKVINGLPAMAYQEVMVSAEDENLKFAIASDINGSSWNTPVVVNSAESVGSYACLALVNGRPGIAAENSSSSRIMFAIPRLE